MTGLRSHTVRPESITGDRVIAHDVLYAMLGDGPWRLWWVFLYVRDLTYGDEQAKLFGRVNVSIAKLVQLIATHDINPPTEAGRKKYGLHRVVTARQVARFLAVLRKAGLLGKEWARKCGDGWLYVRSPRGGLLFRSRTIVDRVIVPAECIAWMKSRNTHGGARKGAGRPRKVATSRPVIQTSRHINPTVQNTTTVQATLRVAGAGQPHPTPAGSFQTKTQKDVQQVNATVASTPLRTFPHRPTDRQLGSMTIPAPPKLPAEPDPVADAKLLWAAYKATCAHIFGRPLHTFEKDKTALERNATLFARCATILREEDVSPIAWATIRCEQWRAMDNKRAPRLQFVFSPRNMEDTIEKFGDRLSVQPMAFALPEAHTLLGRAWLSMLRTYHSRPEWVNDPQWIHIVVETYFPGDYFDRLVRATRAAYAEMNTEAERRMKRGEYVWGPGARKQLAQRRPW